MPLVVSCSGQIERQTLERFEHDVAGDRQVVADLRPLVQRAPQRDHVVEQVAGFFAQCVGRHAPDARSRVVQSIPPTAESWSTSSTRTTPVIAHRHPRARCAPERLRHRAVAIAVVPPGRAAARSIGAATDKDVWPGWWDIAVGGVVAAGESYDDAAARELARGDRHRRVPSRS